MLKNGFSQYIQYMKQHSHNLMAKRKDHIKSEIQVQNWPDSSLTLLVSSDL